MDKAQMHLQQTAFNVLNSVNALIYVTDPETNEIVFINEHMKKHYNLGDVAGQTCYKVLQVGMERQCYFCPIHKLKKDPESAVEWIENNPLTNRIYQNTDRFVSGLGGKKLHIQHSVDITALMNIQEAHEKRESLLNAVNRASALLLSTDISKSIERPLVDGLELIGRSINVDRVHIWKKTVIDKKVYYNCSYSWFSEIGKLEQAVFKNISIPRNHINRWQSAFLRNEIYGGPISTLLPGEQSFLQSFKIKSIIMIPLFINEQLWGFFSVDDCTIERIFKEDEVNILRSISLIMANAINQRVLIQQMNEAHERSLLMLDTSPICAQIWDKNLGTVDCNEAAVKLYGFKDKAEYINRFLADCSTELQPDGERSDIKAVRLVNQAFSDGYCRFKWMHKMPDNDTLIPADVTLVRSMYKDEEIVIGYTHDLREQHRLMKEQEELVKQRIEAEIANQTKSSFLANMSHEIRTPLNTILGVTEILNEHKCLPADAKEGLDKIYISGNLLLNLINDILDFSKIEAGKLDIIPTKYSIKNLISDATHLNVMRIESKPISFVIQADPNLPSKLIGDEIRIKQILNNLLSNAFKYTESGQVTLTVSAEAQANEIETTLVIGVRDTGVGMSIQQVEKLFDEYSRFNEHKNLNIEGTGLGLAITKRLVMLMYGQIHVESEAGVGSYFVVRLPQKIQDNTPIGEKSAEDLYQLRVLRANQKERGILTREPMPYGKVLVVDDVEPNLYVAEGLLRPYGLTVETVTGGGDAIQKIMDGNTYDVIFMDHMMPLMDGMEATRRLREAGYDQPIVALTANAVIGQADLFLRNGFDEFISKPIDIRQLDAVLKRFIRDKQPPEVLAAARQNKEAEAVSNGDASGVLSALRATNAVDVDTALVVLGGMHDVYESTVRLSARLLPETIKKMDECLTQEDFSSFAIEIHGLKSVLRNIGAYHLANTAGEMETAAKNGSHENYLAQYPAYFDRLTDLAERLDAALGAQEAPAGDNPVDPDFLCGQLAKAKAAAIDYDALQATELIKTLDGFRFDEPVKTLLQKTAFALQEFDCAQAIKNINDIEEII